MIWMIWMLWGLPEMNAPEKVAQPLSAQQAVAVGLENNFDILLARIDADIAAAKVGLGKADRLPSVDANAGVSYSNEHQSTNSPFAFGDSDTREFTAAVSLNWRLFDGYRLVANERRYQQLSVLEQTNLRIQIEDTVVAILAAYYDLVRADALLEVAQASLLVSQDRLDKLNIRRELGAVDQTEVLDAMVSLNNDRALLYEQELQRQLAAQRLNLLLARDADLGVQVVDPIPLDTQIPQKELVLSRLRTENTQVQAARVQRQIANEDTAIAKAAFLPKVDLNAGIDWSDSRLDPSAALEFGSVDSTSTNVGVSLGVTFNLFDGRRKKVQLATAEMALKRQDLAIQALELNLAQQLSEKLTTLKQRLQLRDLEMKNVSVAEENLTLTQEQYRLGSTSSLEFRDAQVNLTRARANLVNIHYLTYLAQLDIDQLSGDLLN